MDANDLTNSLYWVSDRRLANTFPPTHYAQDEPDGLLAIGGDLGPERLLEAYGRGIFPWFSAGQPILWWAPDPRAIVRPHELHVSRRLARQLRQQRYSTTYDRAFEDVVAGCAAPRQDQSGTWITDDMRRAYLALHRLGYAHSVECWDGDELVGGIYGVALGRVFFGESMFSRVPNASKIALAELCRWLHAWHYELLDCQIQNPHLERMGVCEVARSDFEQQLEHSLALSPAADAWLRDTSP